MLFESNGKSIMFHLKDMAEEESDELKELIKKNGGKIIDGCDFIFTNPETYNEEETAFDLQYIYDCTRVERILDLDSYVIGRKKLPSCLTILFKTGGERCNCYTSENPNPCKARFFVKRNGNATSGTEHKCATTERGNEKELRIMSTEQMDDSQFSDSIYNPDETQSQQLIDQDKNIELSHQDGDSQFSDSIYNPDETQSQQFIDHDKNIELSHQDGDSQFSDSIYNPDETQSQQFIDHDKNIELSHKIDDTQVSDSIYDPDDPDMIEVPSARDKPNKKLSFEIIRTFKTVSSTDSNVGTNKDVCHVKKEPCLRTETARNNGVDVLIVLSSSSETEAEDILHKSPANIEIGRERMSKSPRDQLPKLQSSNSQRVSVTPERLKPSGSRKGKLREGLRSKNTTHAFPKECDTEHILRNSTNRPRPTEDTTENIPRDTDNSRVISDSDTDYDEVTLDKREKTKNKRREFESESNSDENYSPLIDSDFVSDSDSPKSRKKKGQTSLTKNNASKQSNDDRNAVVTSSRSDELHERLSSSDDDLEPKRIRTWRRTDLPGCSKQSEPSRTQLKTRKNVHCATRNFMAWEQKEMVNYLIKNHLISGAKGNNVWKQMICDGYLQHRTYQSLQNHFRKFILPNIHRYSMDVKSRAEFQKLQPR